MHNYRVESRTHSCFMRTHLLFWEHGHILGYLIHVYVYVLENWEPYRLLFRAITKTNGFTPPIPTPISRAPLLWPSILQENNVPKEIYLLEKRWMEHILKVFYLLFYTITQNMCGDLVALEFCQTSWAGMPYVTQEKRYLGTKEAQLYQWRLTQNQTSRIGLICPDFCFPQKIAL
jgi:hypothetical protein